MLNIPLNGSAMNATRRINEIYKAEKQPAAAAAKVNDAARELSEMQQQCKCLIGNNSNEPRQGPSTGLKRLPITFLTSVIPKPQPRKSKCFPSNSTPTQRLDCAHPL
ncbi:hypothetical protein [Pseudomonas abietaniphila]|jgi:hypothetical protein